ncbi:MAG: hypothetical protein A2Z90_14220 [Burkholderiales bacterium GWA2_64_37]|nr:MAG: hypothetical protein A2Z90_14220 [Burkholderiales bacterium GWA2_64_37]
MAVSPNTRQQLIEISSLLTSNQVQEADRYIRVLISKINPSELALASEEIKQLIQRFMKNRRRDLTHELETRLGNLGASAHTTPQGSVVHSPITPLTADQKLSVRTESMLRLLADQHIFRWKPHYVDALRHIMGRIASEMPDEGEITQIGEAFAGHAQTIFNRGFAFQTQRGVSADVATLKSVGGVQSFVDLIVSVYLERRPDVHASGHAAALWGVTSAAIAGVLRGYGSVSFGTVSGWTLLQKNRLAWLPPVGFCRGSELLPLFEAFGHAGAPGELHIILGASVQAAERMAHKFHGADLFLPRMSRVSPGFVERLDLTYSAKRGALNRDISITCFSGAVKTTQPVEAALALKPAAVVGMFSDQVNEWVERTSIKCVADASGLRTDSQQLYNFAELILGKLEAEGLSRESYSDPAVVTHNYAGDFPLDDPEFRRQFLVERHSVKRLLQEFDGSVGIHLWCSVRRSGKTTAAQELADASGTSLVVSQTMDRQLRQPIQNIFSRAVRAAFEAGKDLRDDFFTEVVRDCALATTASDPSNMRIVFILDEYESLFGLIDSNVRESKGLKYKVALPLLSQMVDFATRNLLVFMGQRPDAFHVLPSDSQLAPLVNQQRFPLFEHHKKARDTEFTQFLKLVLTEKLPFDDSFADAVFAETSGHPYLTVNLMEDFNRWLVDNSFRFASASLKAQNFADFAKDKLTPAALKRSPFYDFFAAQMAEYLSERSRSSEPWLSAVAHTLKALATKHFKTFETTTNGFERLIAPIADEHRIPLGRLQMTATQANFLREENGQVSAGIRILARLAGSVTANIN